MRKIGIGCSVFVMAVIGTAWIANYTFPLAVLQELHIVPEKQLPGVDWQISFGEGSARSLHLGVIRKDFTISYAVYSATAEASSYSQWGNWVFSVSKVVTSPVTPMLGNPVNLTIRQIKTPIGLLFFVPLMFLLGLSRKPFRTYHRKKHGLCITCGYDLRGLTEARCPECGSPYSTI
jgi:hypothetical protein